MTDYIKIPTSPMQSLWRGIEALSLSSRINPQPPHHEGSSPQQSDSAEERERRPRRRFVALRRLINELKESAQITKVDFAIADAELHSLGLAVVEEKLIQQLLQLKIPLHSIEQLLPQIDQNRARVSLGRGRSITSAALTLFPVSAEGLAEYNLKIEELKVRIERFDSKIVTEIDQEGFYVDEQNRLRLIFYRRGAARGEASELLELKISVLLGVIENDEASRRAILYQRADKSYGLYADKLINLSI